MAFELEVEAVGVVVGGQGAGEARGHRGVAQAGLSLAPALLGTCGGSTGPCGAFPPPGQGERAACAGIALPSLPTPSGPVNHRGQAGTGLDSAGDAPVCALLGDWDGMGWGRG